jgi:hypothetical protein
MGSPSVAPTARSARRSSTGLRTGSRRTAACRRDGSGRGSSGRSVSWAREWIEREVERYLAYRHGVEEDGDTEVVVELDQVSVMVALVMEMERPPWARSLEKERRLAREDQESLR